MNIGTSELVIIILLAFFIFGPEKLPEIARNMGKALRNFQRESRRAASVLKRGMEEGGPRQGAPDQAPSQNGADAAPPVDPSVRHLEDT